MGGDGRWMSDGYTEVEAPGPEVAMQAPRSPVNLAYAQAMKAAISSWRAWTNLILPPTPRRT